LHQVEEKSDNSKDSSYEESEQILYHFPKNHTKNVFGDFKVKLGREYCQTNNWE